MKYTNTTKAILLILGFALIFIQILGFIGMSKTDVGLYPSKESFSTPIFSSRSDLNIKMVFFAVEAGTDRFASSLEDLTNSEDKYRTSTSEQYASAYIREALGCSDGGSFGLIIYDAVLTISYCFVGILGFLLLFVDKIWERIYWKAYWKDKQKELESETEEN